MNISEIGWFQFENLVKNRVPFLLLNLGVDLSGLFQGLEQKHVRSLEIQTTATRALEDLKKRSQDFKYAVIVLCPKGDESAPLVHAVEAAGYLNVYSIHGGLQGLIQEKST